MSDEIVALGLGGRVQPRPYSEFAEDGGDVSFDGGHTNEEEAGDLPIGPPLRNETENLDLARGQSSRSFLDQRTVQVELIYYLQRLADSLVKWHLPTHRPRGGEVGGGKLGSCRVDRQFEPGLLVDWLYLSNSYPNRFRRAKQSDCLRRSSSNSGHGSQAFEAKGDRADVAAIPNEGQRLGE